MNPDNICFVRAKMKEDYVFDGIRAMGYPIFIPYTDRNLLLRCIREGWFRLKLPGRQLFYNRRLKKTRADIFIVKDPLITPDFLRWLQATHRDARILLEYDNRVSRTIDPRQVPKGIELWSYDPQDCETYGMRRKTPNYLDLYRIRPDPQPIWDILYLGRDKGRAEALLALQKEFESRGLRTHFHICADRRYLQKQKSCYKPLLTYKEYLQMLKKSRAILNIMPESQRGITQREMECVFDGIKCFTNNRAIREFPLYHPSRFFILGQDSLDRAKEFLQTEFLPISEEALEPYRYYHTIETMVGK